MRRWLKAELHSHTIEDPEDGGKIVLHSPQELISAASQQGFEVLAITNHEQVLFSAELRDYAESRGVLLIPGVEANIQGKHFLLYNFPDYDPSWKNPEVIRQHKGTRQLVIAPHPFFPSRSALRGRFHQWADLFDAVEYNHFYLPWLNFNSRAEEAARRFDKVLIGNSDVHHLFQLGRTYSRILAEKTVESVVSAIKEKQVQLVTNPVEPSFILRWFVLNATYRSRYLLRQKSFGERTHE